MENSLQLETNVANESSLGQTTELRPSLAAAKSSGSWRTLSLRQLQRFEAEIQAKGFVPQTKGTNRSLTQHIAQEIAHWRWCAKRMGVAVELDFVIDLKSYLHKRIAELSVELKKDTVKQANEIRILSEQVTRWSDEPQNQLSLAYAIEYLDSFLAALEQPDVKLIFKKALRDTFMLNLARLKSPRANKTLRLMLPLSREELRSAILANCAARS